MIHAFVTSPLTHAIGLALVHFLWQGVVIAGLVAVALRWLSLPSSARYGIGCAGLAAMALAPVVTVYWVLAGGAPVTFVGVGSIVTSGRAAADVAAAATTFDRALLAVVVAWAAGVLALSGHLTSGWLAVSRLRRGAGSGSQWEGRVAALAERLGIRRTVRVFESSAVDVPSVLGWLRPVLLVPAGALAGLSPAQVDAILVHELAHVRRHDYFVNICQSAVETLLFYHPAVWWVSRQVRIEREHCCDDVAVAECGDRVSYARALTALDERRSGALVPGMAASGGELVRRVRRLLHATPPEPSRTPAWSALAVVVVVLPLVFGLTIRVDGAATSDESRDARQAQLQAANVSTPPVRVRYVPPVYPAAARAANVTGIVIVQYTIDQNGNVVDPVILMSNPIFDEAALDALQQWQYTPPMHDGQPVPVTATVTINFADPGNTSAGGSFQTMPPPPPPPPAGSTGSALPPHPSAPPATGADRHVSFGPDVLRIGGNIAPPRRLAYVPPVYPALARQAKVGGIVIVELLIGTDGSVGDARVLESAPMLEQAALDAVLQWRYEPTLRNGVPVPVQMTVTINFVP